MSFLAPVAPFQSTQQFNYMGPTQPGFLWCPQSGFFLLNASYLNGWILDQRSKLQHLESRLTDRMERRLLWAGPSPSLMQRLDERRAGSLLLNVTASAGIQQGHWVGDCWRPAGGTRSWWIANESQHKEPSRAGHQRWRWLMSTQDKNTSDDKLKSQILPLWT